MFTNIPLDKSICEYFITITNHNPLNTPLFAVMVAKVRMDEIIGWNSLSVKKVGINFSWLNFAGWQKTESFGVARKNEPKFRTSTFLKIKVGSKAGRGLTFKDFIEPPQNLTLGSWKRTTNIWQLKTWNQAFKIIEILRQ